MKLAVVMDPIEKIVPEKDGTLDLLLAAQDRNYELTYFQQEDLKIIDGRPLAKGKVLSVKDNTDRWFEFSNQNEYSLSDFDVILMRKDPPFNMEYIYSTYILDLAENSGVKVINHPSALRNFNEKVSISLFPSLTPKTLVTSSLNEIKAFLDAEEKIVVKPLDGMGGKSVFVVDKNDRNAHSIFETITNLGTTTIMAQVYVPEIEHGDKRIHIVYGQHCNTALARIPNDQDNRGNLVMGATGETQELSSRDQKICEAIGPTLLEHGIYFAGIDVIGDYLTEINITSPTGMREIKRNSGEDVSSFFFETLESKK